MTHPLRRSAGRILFALSVLPACLSAQTIAGCTEAEAIDLTDPGASRVISFTCCQYTPKCVKIEAGQNVSFQGTFISHPLGPIPSDGNPITSVSSGSVSEFTFPESGGFGFYCSNHGDVTGNGMSGAVFVTPFRIFADGFDVDSFCTWSAQSGGPDC